MKAESGANRAVQPSPQEGHTPKLRPVSPRGKPCRSRPPRAASGTQTQRHRSPPARGPDAAAPGLGAHRCDPQHLHRSEPGPSTTTRRAPRGARPHQPEAARPAPFSLRLCPLGHLATPGRGPQGPTTRHQALGASASSIPHSRPGHASEQRYAARGLWSRSAKALRHPLDEPPLQAGRPPSAKATTMNASQPSTAVLPMRRAPTTRARSEVSDCRFMPQRRVPPSRGLDRSRPKATS
jgi:hypothetical protein